MTDQRTRPESPAANRGSRANAAGLLWWALGIAVLVFVGVHAKIGADEPRIANPQPSEQARRAVEDLPNWAPMCNLWTLVMMLVGGAIFAFGWRRHPRHPYLLLVLAGTALPWLDPQADWVSYSVFSPDLWHFPVDWPWVSVSPLIEPFVCIAYASVLIVPAFAAIPLLRSVQRRRPLDSFVSRHPLITLSVITLVIGFALDAAVEIFCVSKRVYAYSQVPAFGSIFAGHFNQFPLLWESGLATSMMIAASVMVYRDDTGRTQAEKLALRLRLFPHRPALASFLVMFAALSLSYSAVYGGGFLTIRAAKLATVVACPWPFPQSKVYDPQGFYEKAGHPGPFFDGKWNTWLSGQPDGRPTTTGPVPAGRCGPGHD